MCKQWAELVHSPPLLTSLEVSIIEGSDGLPHLRSLEAWLARRAAGHVRQLQLKAVLLLDDHMEHATEAAAALSSALAPLASSLCDLSLVTSDLPLPPLDSWLAPLVGLTSLSLTTDYTNVSIAGPLGCLSALQRLRLSIVDGDVSLAPEASLPPALTHLWFGTVDSPLPSQVSLALSQLFEFAAAQIGDQIDLVWPACYGMMQPLAPPSLPQLDISRPLCLFPPSTSYPKVGGLRHLQELAVVRTTTTAEQYAPLARLHSSLTALSITDGDHMPGCLAQLTALRSLSEYCFFPRSCVLAQSACLAAQVAPEAAALERVDNTATLPAPKSSTALPCLNCLQPFTETVGCPKAAGSPLRRRCRGCSSSPQW